MTARLATRESVTVTACTRMNACHVLHRLVPEVAVFRNIRVAVEAASQFGQRPIKQDRVKWEEGWLPWFAGPGRPIDDASRKNRHSPVGMGAETGSLLARGFRYQ